MRIIPEVKVGVYEQNATMGVGAAIISLVICVGAVVYLRRNHYIRRATAYSVIGIFALVLLFFVHWTNSGY